MRVAFIIASIAWAGIASAVAIAPVIEVGDEGFNPAEGAGHDSFKNRATLINQWRIDAKSKFHICLNKTAEYDGVISTSRDAVKKQMSQLKKGDPHKKVLTTYSAELTAYVEGPLRQFKEVCNKLETYLNELDVFEVQTRDYYGAGPATTVDTGLGDGYRPPARSLSASTALASTSLNLLSAKPPPPVPMPENEFQKKEKEFSRRMQELQESINQNPMFGKTQDAVPVPINLVAADTQFVTTDTQPVPAAAPPAQQADPAPIIQNAAPEPVQQVAPKFEDKLLSVFKKTYDNIQ